MRRVATAAILSTLAVLLFPSAVLAQFAGPSPTPTAVTVSRTAITPLGIYALGGIGCAAITPIVGTILLNRELTGTEVRRSTLNCFLGPVGWIVGPVLFPGEAVAVEPPRTPPRRGAGQARGRNIGIPPPGETRFVPDEILLDVAAGAAPRALAAMARRLQLTLLETQSFTLTGRTLQRWRIGGNGSVAETLRALSRYRIVTAAQPNYRYALQQTAEPAPADAVAAQYVVSKLHLTQAHRISNGDDVLVAVIDSQIDTRHPDLSGVIADRYDALAVPGKPHAHGTAMAGAIAAHSKLIGVAPKVRILAVRSFAGEGESADGTSFAILKGLDWSASHGARVVNMSFAGPSDMLMREMLDKARARGIVLIAAVGNAGPRSPPLYPAAYAAVIGVTATDADDKLLAVANRGAQVALAAPGVAVLALAPDEGYALSSGTSIAAAHVSGVAALLLARDPRLKPDALLRTLIASAQRIPGKSRDVGAGVVDAYGAVERLKR
jgi:subtilisin family serine protease